MKKQIFLLILVGVANIFVTCKPKASEQNIENAVISLTNKFQQLPKIESNPLDYYKLIRSVLVGKNNLQIQLRVTPDTVEDVQQIIVIINEKGQCYAVPFFSNTYQDYWDFQFDSAAQQNPKNNITFEKEIITALDTLGLNDTLGTAGLVLDEIVLSLLHCRTVQESDSSDLQTVAIMKINNNAPIDNSDSCFIRMRKNYKTISSTFHSAKYYTFYNAFWDEQNNRIYQFTNSEKSRRKSEKWSVKVYRQGCFWKTLEL